MMKLSTHTEEIDTFEFCHMAERVVSAGLTPYPLVHLRARGWVPHDPDHYVMHVGKHWVSVMVAVNQYRIVVSLYGGV